MKRSLWCAFLLSLALLLSACAPPLAVRNDTDIPVRAIVRQPDMRPQTVSVSPHQSSVVEGTAMKGTYRVTVIPDQEWLEYAKLTRKYLNEQLANSDRLTLQQLQDVIRRLKDIAQQMAQFENAAGAAAGCSGEVETEAGKNTVSITIGADGKLAAECR